MGRHEEALQRILRALADALEVTRQVPPQAQTPYLGSLVAYALAGLGRAEEARSLCARLRQELDTGPPFTLFVLGATHARSGDCDAALDILVESRRVRDGQLAFVLTNHHMTGCAATPVSSPVHALR